MPSLFPTHTASRFLQVPSLPTRKASSPVPNESFDDISDDLELSFASNMSLNPTTTEDRDNRIASPVPMDISPALPTRVAPSKFTTRPRAFTSSARLFGRDVSNENLQPPSISSGAGTGTTSGKKLQRAALPFEWMAPSRPEQTLDTTDSSQMDHSDPMDVDTSYNTNPQEISISVKDWDAPPTSAAPTVTDFNALFYEAQSPPRSTTTTSPPLQEFIGKRRSHSPESVTRSRVERLSSPPPSSPSMRKLERIVSAGVPSRNTKPGLDSLGIPSSMRPRRLVLSAVGPVNVVSQTRSAYPTLERADSLFPARRAFSAMLPPNIVDIPSSPLDEESFDSVEASPAQAYMKRQQNKTLRRCDGSDNLRPNSIARLTPSRQTESPRNLGEPSPRSRWLAPGFGDSEAHGKILPCHRVKEDGLMRINQQTLNDLLDGVFDSKLTSYHIIDCRFDYEYNGGHIPGALNVNTTAAVEEFLLGANALKPKPSVSGDASGKTVLIFHCEFSAKRAPTFAKHLRSKDRAMSNHLYPKIHYPEVYILEGGYSGYFKDNAHRCDPPHGYVQMDDPNHATSRREDLDQFRKAKFGRTKSYAYGDSLSGCVKMTLAAQQKRNTAPSNGTTKHPLFAAATAARTRRGGNTGLATLTEDGNTTAHSEDEETDIGDSPCPPPNRTSGPSMMFKGKKIGRAPLIRAETYGPMRLDH
ncbi:hypothetical protein BDM02DRAFT_3188462 [Thelephora ganbajun]|uniref:Uncharacterized protein n=1 Tax=Thelephora ganbajun TaxID=370292 RepID=A0ACB6ZBS7_THEGA|nr:hypothetical protein BDM02DRAFT_3188462 [Thelephora ganbajun]